MAYSNINKLYQLILIALVAVPNYARAGEGSPGWDEVAPLLDKHCARCHEIGKTTGKFKDRPAGDFGYVLDEDKLVTRNKLILGNADASQIFVKTQKGDMPKDIDDGCYDGTATPTTYCGLTKDEMVALHDGINAMKAAPPTPVAEAQPQPQPQPVVADTEAPPPRIVDGPSDAQSKVVENRDAPPEPAQQSAAPPAPVVVAAPPPQMFISDNEIIRLIAEDAGRATDTDRPNYRYFTLTHFYNAGEPEKDMRVYRMALAKLLNSLSTEADPVEPVAIDPYKTIFRVDISRLGWTHATWDNIVAADPYVILYHNSQFRALQTDLKTQVPFMRADWFTFSASRPPLYYSILNLPKTKGELQRQLGLNVARDFAGRRVERAGFQKSGVSENNRMIERHAISTGMYWESYDFGSNGEHKSLFSNPFGPPGAFGDLSQRVGFQQDGGEIIWTLPNGFHAYYLTKGNGDRLDIGPTNIVHDTAQRDLSVTNGISCMGCHDKGMKFNDFRPGQPLDQIRDLVMRSGSYSAEAKEIASQIFPTGDAMNKRMESDLRHYTESLAAAGVNVNTKDDGVEMVNALSRRFEENLNAKLAAAELGMEPEAFMERLNAAGGQAYDLKMRLQQDIVPRDQFVAIFAQLVNTINDQGDKAVDLTKLAQNTGTTVAAVTNATVKPATYSKSFDLAFFANATSFRVGDYVTFTLKSEQPCFLSILDADDKGRSVVLFPNAQHPDGKIDAGVTIQVPGPVITGFQIKASEAGTERITASCNASFDHSVQQDFSNGNFTSFQSTRDLLSAQTDARMQQQAEVRKRLLTLEATQPSGAHVDTPVLSKEANPVALVANTADPLVPIVAQKSVVLQIRAH